MHKLLLIYFISFFLYSCGGGGRKVVIMASGTIKVNGNTVNLQPGTTHNEETIVPDGDKITVNSPSGDKDFDLKESGLYLLNLKKDTIAGSYQKTGTDNSQIVITQENLWERVDSLTMLMKGQGVSEAKRNYSIPPMTIAKITKNTDAQIIGPFRKIPGSFDPSREHEVYKFNTNKEISEIIEKVKKNMAK
ncbi:MAG TPA: hypothetical protein VM101_14455 [Flavitalea sp.]|nr:hypothetical protein [Flavitalea sp.]